MKASRSAALTLALGISLLVATGAHAAPGPAGTLSQLAGPAGCITDDGNPGAPDPDGTCTDARAIDDAYGMAVSPDGRNLYETNDDNGLVVFSRSPATGALTQLAGTAGCVTQGGTATGDDPVTPVGCETARALDDPEAVVVSPDGKHVYVGSYSAHEIAAFSRNPSTGALTQLPGTAGCVSDDGTATGDDPTTPVGCVDGREIAGGYTGLAISPDGKFVYSSNSSGGVAVLQRDASTGALSQSTAAGGCVSQDGTATGDPDTHGCSTGLELSSPSGLTLSADGSFLYVGNQSSSGVDVLRRDATTGALTQVPGAAGGCVSDDGTDDNGNAGACVDGRGVSASYFTVLSPDGRNLYAAGYDDGTIAAFSVNPATGGLTQLAGTAGCVSGDGTTGGDDPTTPIGCVAARGLSGPYPLAASADGRAIYDGDYGSDTIVVLRRDAATGALSESTGKDGCVSSDGTTTSDPGTLGCADGRAIKALNGLVTSPDGTSLYGASSGVTAYSVQVAPTCTDASASTPFATPVTVTLSCNDLNGDPLTLSAVSVPAHGSLGPFSSSAVTYTPGNGFSGSDAFTFHASDGTNVSAPATARVQVGAPKPPTPESARRPKFVGSSRLKARKNKTITIKLSCPAGVHACTGTLSLTAKRLGRIARKHYSVPAGKTRSFKLTLSKKARKALGKHGRIKAKATATPAGGLKKVTRNVTIVGKRNRR